MYPSSTTYRLARPGGEYNRLYALAKRAGYRPRIGDFQFPTVVAERAGKVIGFVATQPGQEAVVAGPLVIDGGPNPFVFLRLADAYENVLRQAGVKVFLHTIDKERPEHVKMMERLGFTRWSETENDVVMHRKLGD